MAEQKQTLTELENHLAEAMRLLASFRPDKTGEPVELKADISSRAITLQEEERRRVARDLHDGPVQTVSNIVLRLDICQKMLNKRPEVLEAEIEEIKQVARSCLNELRKFIFDLRPLALDDLGFAAAVRQYVKEFGRRTGVKVSCDIPSNLPRLESDRELSMFRIVQEALNNIYKHSGCNQASVKVALEGKSMRIVIEDNGKGFDMESTEKNKAKLQKFGLTSMRERSELLRGCLDIETMPGAGTRVCLSLPLED